MQEKQTSLSANRDGEKHAGAGNFYQGIRSTFGVHEMKQQCLFIVKNADQPGFNDLI
jgi:hypothetical protein